MDREQEKARRNEICIHNPKYNDSYFLFKVACTHIYAHTHTHTHTHAHAHTHIHTHTHAHTHMHMHTQTDTHKHTHSFTYSSTYTNAHFILVDLHKNLYTKTIVKYTYIE